MASVGKIEELNPKNTNIDHYLDRLEQYFKLLVHFKKWEKLIHALI